MLALHPYRAASPPPGTALMDGLVGLGLLISIQLFHRGAVTTTGWGWQHFGGDQ